MNTNFVELVKNALPPKKHFGGFFIGEKVIFCATLNQLVYVCGDFVTASKLKKGLSECGKSVQIISCGRENEDEFDVNLSPFASAISNFLKGQLDVLIFLPSSLSTKFDLDFLKTFAKSSGIWLRAGGLCDCAGAICRAWRYC